MATSPRFLCRRRRVNVDKAQGNQLAGIDPADDDSHGRKHGPLFAAERLPGPRRWRRSPTGSEQRQDGSHTVEGTSIFFRTATLQSVACLSVYAEPDEAFVAVEDGLGSEPTRKLPRFDRHWAPHQGEGA